MSDVPAIKADGLVKHYGKTKALDGLDLTVPAGPSTACSARTGRARPPPSASWRRCCARTAAGARPRPRCGRRRSRRPPDDRPHRPVRGAGRVPHRARQPDHDRPAHRLTARAARQRADELLEQFDLTAAGEPGGQDLLRRHAPAARPGGVADRPPGGAVPGRADDRARPERPRADVGHRPPAGRRRHHAAAHHPVPRRGGRARQPGRRHRRRQGHRRGRAPNSRRPSAGSGC